MLIYDRGKLIEQWNVSHWSTISLVNSTLISDAFILSPRRLIDELGLFSKVYSRQSLEIHASRPNSCKTTTHSVETLELCAVCTSNHRRTLTTNRCGPLPCYFSCLNGKKCRPYFLGKRRSEKQLQIFDPDTED